MHTTASIATTADITQSAVWERAKSLGLTPERYIGRAAVWTDAQVRQLTQAPPMGRPRATAK